MACERMTEYLKSPESDETPEFIGENGWDAGRLTELFIRVWSVDPEDVAWSSGHAAICLMADVLCASGGQLVPESRQTLIARFDCQETAINTARRLQRALLAFEESSATSGFAASIAVRRPEDQVRSENSTDIADLLWSHATPGQILVSNAVHETLRFIPRLQFQEASTHLSQESAYRELLWTDAETLTAWQNHVDSAARSLQIESAYARPPIEAVGAESQGTEPVGEMGVVRLEDQVQTSNDGSARRNRIWLAAGAVCVALIAAMGVVVHFNGRITREVPHLPARNQAIGQQSIPHVDVPTFPGAAPDKPLGAATEKTVPQTAPNRVTSSRQKTVPATDVPVSEYKGFTNKQVPQLLHRAEEDAGAGNYDDAKREYEIVLKLQPANSAAKEGLRKLGMKTGKSR
jgi:hypothetical protein